MVCLSCRTENRPGRRFCSHCGAPLSVVCASCGEPNDPDDRFCGRCGTPLTADAPLAASTSPPPDRTPIPVAERRLVSVLFADLVGFTSLSEERDAEDVRDLLSKYFEDSRRLVTLYGGSVEKFIGDAVMAVWGAPVAQEDDAERAVRTALDLVASVDRLGADLGVPDLRARAGVLTGEAAVTLGAQGQGMVAGDLVNSASRVQSVALPGHVYVGKSTRRATEAAISYEDAGMHQLKGKVEPVPLWRATRVVAGRRGALKSAGLEAPFIGRGRELKLLKELFHASSEERRAHLVSVLGVAGTGKSRMSWEFFKYIDGLAGNVYWHRGRCLAYGEGVAYWALVEMVKSRCGIVEEEEAESARAKLKTMLQEHLADPDERRRVEPRLAHLLGLEEGASHSREDLFSSWRLFFERLAEASPTVLVFEDVHWADTAVLDFIEHLLEWSRNHPLFVITLARPEFTERRPGWGAGGRNFTSLYLEPLPAETIRQLLTGLAPGLPDDLCTQILTRAEGVPLYAVETIRMLLDRELLVREGNVYRPSGPIETLEVPETLLALVAARLDGLTAEERRVCQNASVLGRTFAVPALSTLSGLSEKKLESILSTLVRKELLSHQASSALPESSHYGFLQDLVRKVAYETLSRKDRKAKQLAAAAIIESTSGSDESETVEVVAAHYLAAYREAPAASDASDIRDKTRGLLIRAGERAASLAAPAEAQRYFTQAIELTAQSNMKADLLERAGQMALQGGGLERARADFESAMSLFASEGNGHSFARVTARLGEVDWLEGRLDEAVERMEEALPVLLRHKPDADLATVAAQLGRLHFFRGHDAELALQRIETALSIAEPMGFTEVVSQALNTKSLVLLYQGRPEESVGLVRHALDVALKNDHSSAALRAYNNLAELLFRRDRYEESVRVHEEGLALARRVGDRLWEHLLLSELTYPLFVLGRWKEALESAAQVPEEEMDRADSLGLLMVVPAILVARGVSDEARQMLRIFERFEDSADVQERAAYEVARATVERAEGNFVSAHKAAREAVDLGRRVGPDGHMFRMGLEQAMESALALEDFSEVEALLAIVHDLRRAEITPMLRSIALLTRARLDAIAGRAEAVEMGLTNAAALFREIGAIPWLGAVLHDLGNWLSVQGRDEEAQALLDESRDIDGHLGALHRFEHHRPPAVWWTEVSQAPVTSTRP